MPSNRTARAIIGSAVTIGVVADQLFRTPVWGINLPIAAILLAAAATTIPAPGRRALWPWLASVFFAAMWAVRDAESLLAMDLLAALSLASLPLLQERSIQLKAVELIDLVTAPLRTAWAISAGTLGFASFARTHLVTTGASGPNQRARAITVGVLLAVPLLLLFGALFAAADPVFNHALSSVFFVDIGPLAAHTITAGLLAWATAGFLWTLAKPPRPAGSLLALPQIGGLQVLTPLVATVVLFAVFVGVQATSLFGGATFVETTTGLTYAEYARGGFFELQFAAMLVLPMVYFAPAFAGPLDPAATARLRRVMGVQIGLTALVLASALWRMGLYVNAYGLTEDRVNGIAFMIWIAMTLVVFALTVVRGQPRHAAFGSLVAAVVTLAALNLVNPHAMIARYNLANAGNREVDVANLSRLGGDAVPILVSQLSLLPADQRCTLTAKIRKRYLVSGADWRGWNLSRERAREAARSLAPTEPCPVTAKGGGAP